MNDPGLSWREGVGQFLHDCCYGEKKGIAVLTIEEQQQIFKRLSGENCQIFREKQRRLFGQILECFGITSSTERIQPVYESEPDGHGHTKGSPPYAPFFVPEAMDETVEFQVEAITDALEAMKNSSSI